MTAAKVESLPTVPNRLTFLQIILFLISGVFVGSFWLSWGVFITPCFPIYPSGVLLKFQDRCENLAVHEQAFFIFITFYHLIQLGATAMFLCMISFAIFLISLWHLNLGRYML